MAAAAATTVADQGHSATPHGSSSSHSQQVAIKISGDFTWSPDQPATLTNLNLVIDKGALVAVVGPTGSGKTSLISAMLGLLQGVSSNENVSNIVTSNSGDSASGNSWGGPQVQVWGSTAYVPQAPFILGGTIRDNVIFGREFEQQRYHAAVTAAQLEADFAALPGGDMTELGEHVTNGGCHSCHGLVHGLKHPLL